MGTVKHGRGEAALHMVSVFESVGASKFDITFTDLDGNKRGFRPSQPIEEVRRSLRSTLIESCTARGTNIIVRPHKPPAVFLVQLDDLENARLEKVKPSAFLVLETSSGNHQAWVAVEGGDTDFARRLRKGTGADLTASGATRVAGTVNFKRKYEPNFPTVSIIEAQLGRTITQAELEGRGLVAAPDPLREASTLRVSSGGRRPRGRWPSYEVCVKGAPPNHDNTGPDISRADFTWCMTAIDWGHSIEDTAERLLQQSTKARENGEQYAQLTAQRAAAAVERGRSRA